MQVSIDRIAFGGDGVARTPDGKVLFVPFAAPGDQLDVEVVHQTPRYARARIREVLTPGAGRTEPRCPYFGRCGGCCYQHLDAATQVTLKTEQLTEALQRIGKLTELPPVDPVVSSPQVYGYRNKLELHLMSELDAAFPFGLAGAGTESGVVPEACAIADNAVNELLAAMQRRLLTGAFHAPKTARRLTLRHPAHKRRALFFWDSKPAARALVERCGTEEFVVPATAFWQTNPHVIQSLTDTVSRFVGPDRHGLFVDAYAGCGLFAITAGREFEQRVLIEADPAAADAARRNLDSRHCKDSRVRVGETGQYLPPLLAAAAAEPRPVTVIADPPRGGCEPPVIQALCDNPPTRLVYVSCNAPTLARDLNALVAGGPFAVRRLALLDLFPQTAHFETVALLAPRDTPRPGDPAPSSS